MGAGLLINACGLSGPKPDKRINATLELMADNPSEKEINDAILALQHRFEKFNVYPTVERIENSKSLKFTLETHADGDRVRNFLVTPGKLEFYHVIIQDELLMHCVIADDWLMENEGLVNPITSKFYKVSPSMLLVTEKDTAAIGHYLRMNAIRNLWDGDKKRIKFLWGLLDTETHSFPLYALRTGKLGKAPLDGSFVESAAQIYDYGDRPAINITMNAEGAGIWEEMTHEAFINASQIAVVVDDVVFSVPGVSNGRIVGGRSQISGDFTEEEARDLAASISSESIPAMKILSYSFQPLE